MPPLPEIVRKGGYKFRTLEMHLQLRYQLLKIISYIYIDSYQNLRVNENQKSTVDTKTRKINTNTTLKIVIKPQEERTREERKKKEKQKQI